jgi:excisionase family DNA binding protein
VAGRAARSGRAAELAVERARYDADRAERSFSACEPENRLVARTLESRWEDKLKVLADARAALAAVSAATPQPPDPAALTALLADVHTLWHADTTCDRDRKRLLRTLISDVTILPEAAPDLVRIGIRWHTGAVQEITCVANPPRSEPGFVAVIRERSGHLTDVDLAEHLNTLGHRTPRGKVFTESSAGWTRQRYRIPATNAVFPGEVTVPQAAAILHINDSAVYRWITTGRLPARHTAGGQLRIDWTPTVKASCQALIAASTQINPTASHTDTGGAV